MRRTYHASHIAVITFCWSAFCLKPELVQETKEMGKERWPRILSNENLINLSCWLCVPTVRWVKISPVSAQATEGLVYPGAAQPVSQRQFLLPLLFVVRMDSWHYVLGMFPSKDQTYFIFADCFTQDLSWFNVTKMERKPCVVLFAERFFCTPAVSLMAPFLAAWQGDDCLQETFLGFQIVLVPLENLELGKWWDWIDRTRRTRSYLATNAQHCVMWCLHLTCFCEGV